MRVAFHFLPPPHPAIAFMGMRVTRPLLQADRHSAALLSHTARPPQRTCLRDADSITWTARVDSPICAPLWCADPLSYVGGRYEVHHYSAPLPVEAQDEVASLLAYQHLRDACIWGLVAVRDLTTRTILQNDDSYHLGLRCNALHEIKWP